MNIKTEEKMLVSEAMPAPWTVLGTSTYPSWVCSRTVTNATDGKVTPTFRFTSFSERATFWLESFDKISTNDLKAGGRRKAENEFLFSSRGECINAFGCTLRIVNRRLFLSQSYR
jgi:hypothetical protein